MTAAHRGGRTLALALALSLLLAGSALAGTAAGPVGGAQAVIRADGDATAARSLTVNRRRVIAISLDGLNPRSLKVLGRKRAPHLHRLLARGARTTNARTQVEMTLTLPNHVSMVTGRRIDAAHGGHGVTWNSHVRGTTVQRAAGHDVSSVFTVVADGGGSTAVFTTKRKLSILDRSWPAAIDRSVVRESDDAAATRAMRRDFVAHRRSFVLLHLGLADAVGHRRGWLSRPYLRAVRRLDHLVGSVARMVRDRPRLRRSTTIVLTADHGGRPGTRHHDDPTRRANYRVPFVVWGAGVDAGPLYLASPGYVNPGRSRPGFAGPQPVRNGDLANLATDVLGLGPVPGSLWNADQQLRWR